ncbi:MAG: hypothetical protein ACOY0T_22860 [Myxococcota bacterium]
MKKALFFSIAGSGGLALAAFVVFTRESDEAARAAKLAKELEQLRSEVSDLRSSSNGERHLGALQQALVLAQHRGAQGRAAEGSNASRAPSADGVRMQVTHSDPTTLAQELKARNQRAANRLGEQLDAQLQTERIDTGWAPATRTAIETAFSSLPKDRVLSSECRQSLCRVAVQHESIDGQREMAKAITAQPPFDQDVLFRYDSEHTPPSTILYVARAGVTLASLVNP